MKSIILSQNKDTFIFFYLIVPDITVVQKEVKKK